MPACIFQNGQAGAFIGKDGRRGEADVRVQSLVRLYTMRRDSTDPEESMNSLNEAKSQCGSPALLGRKDESSFQASLSVCYQRA